MDPTSPQPNASSPQLARRNFLKKSLAMSVAAPMLMSFEEQALIAQEKTSASNPATSAPAGKMPQGKIGKIQISRLICGGNLISGYAHSRDLIYVSELLKHYFSDEKIMDTWALCEREGINSMVAYPGDPHAVEVYRKYRQRGGRIQYLAQINPTREDLKTCVKEAVDAGAVGAFLVGNLGDLWTREGEAARIGELVKNIKDQGLIAGVAGHELRTTKAVEEAGVNPDSYVKTLHNNNYWSKQQPDQTKDVIDNYSTDNYWCREPRETVAFMSEVERPWIAYKVLAAGAIHPRSGFRYAFENGADFALVGMFDFQVTENVKVASEILASRMERQREWMA